MKYAELDERAQEKAFEKWRENEPGYQWWDSTYEDAVICARKLGIEIDEREYKTVGSGTGFQPDISFSGFCNQGDGCCFSGTLRVAEMFEATKDMAAHAPGDEELMRLAGVAENIYGMIAAYRVAQRMADNPVDEYPECCTTMTMRINGKERSYSTQVDDNYAPPEIDKACDEFLGHFADWIYGHLEVEYDYLSGDDAFAEWVKDNDPDFDEDGNY